MRCSQAKALISLYLGPEASWLRARDRQALEAHLTACEACRRDWRESREALELLQEYWQISEDTQALLSGSRPSDRQGIYSRIISLPAWRRPAAATVAAGLVLTVLSVWAILPRESARTGPDRRVALPEAERPLTIASADGDRLSPGTWIETAAGETKSLVLNARHRVVMRGGTRLSCEPVVENGRTGCRVNLARGEIFARVEHDGNPFRVQTARGRAVITGTVFDIRVGRTATTLAVVEGSVRFESAAGHVQVVAGQSSTSTAMSAAPSVPVWCDAAALTAWVRPDQGTVQAVENTPPDDSTLDDLSVTLSSRVEVQADLDALDYRQWVEQKRDWFRQQFPWVFALQKALEKEGVQADYPTLLRQSGQLWQFTYRQEDPGRQVEPDAGGLLRAASVYGRNEDWLKHQMLLPPDAHSGAPRAQRPEAFERWAADLETRVSTCPPDADARLLSDTVNACLYLINTRTLALLSLRRGLPDEAPQARDEREGLLQEQLRLLGRCVRLACEPSGLQRVRCPCEGADQCRDLAGEIRKMATLEKRLTADETIIRP
jgi:ferric-dicitrate binding protein FerR (iron transport regulator)